MKAYGRRSGVCQCPYCGIDKKESTRKGTERQKVKKDLKKERDRYENTRK